MFNTVPFDVPLNVPLNVPYINREQQFGVIKSYQERQNEHQNEQCSKERSIEHQMEHQNEHQNEQYLVPETFRSLRIRISNSGLLQVGIELQGYPSKCPAAALIRSMAGIPGNSALLGFRRRSGP